MQPVHPGGILRDELDELGLSANALSKALGVRRTGPRLDQYRSGAGVQPRCSRQSGP